MDTRLNRKNNWRMNWLSKRRANSLVMHLSLLFAIGWLLTLSRESWGATLNSTNAMGGPEARVVTVCDPGAMDAFRARPEIVRLMVDRGITKLARRSSVAEAWRAFVTTQDVVGIKVYSTPGPNSGTRPAVVAAIVEGLLSAGLPPRNILVWDRQAGDLRLAGFYDLADRYSIQVAGSAQAGYDEKNFYDTPLIGTLVYGDYEFGKQGAGLGRKSYVSKLVSRQMTKIINVAPLLNHNQAGVSGLLYSLASGSIDNMARFESDADRLSRAIPEIYALPALSDHVALSITDALLCQYEGGERGLLHYSVVLNELRFSRDPVALDTLALQDLERQRQTANVPTLKANADLYNNAAILELGVSDMKRIHVETVNLKE